MNKIPPNSHLKERDCHVNKCLHDIFFFGEVGLGKDGVLA